MESKRPCTGSPCSQVRRFAPPNHRPSPGSLAGRRNGRHGAGRRVFGKRPGMALLINALDNRHEQAWIVGHNPGLSELVERLTEQPVWLPNVAWLRLSFKSTAGRGLAGVGRLRPTTPKSSLAHDPVQRSMVGVGGLARPPPWRFGQRLLPLGAIALSFAGRPVVGWIATRAWVPKLATAGAATTSP